MAIVLQKAMTALDDRHNRLIHRIRTLDRENLADPGIPKDFDPVAYLLLNPDLLESNIPIVHHFLQHGAREGRSFRL